MSDGISKEMKLNFIIDTSKSMRNITELKDTISSISQLDLKSFGDTFGEITKGAKNAMFELNNAIKEAQKNAYKSVEEATNSLAKNEQERLQRNKKTEYDLTKVKQDEAIKRLNAVENELKDEAKLRAKFAEEFKKNNTVTIDVKADKKALEKILNSMQKQLEKSSHNLAFNADLNANGTYKTQDVERYTKALSGLVNMYNLLGKSKASLKEFLSPFEDPEAARRFTIDKSLLEKEALAQVEAIKKAINKSAKQSVVPEDFKKSIQEMIGSVNGKSFNEALDKHVEASLKAMSDKAQAIIKEVNDYQAKLDKISAEIKSIGAKKIEPKKAADTKQSDKEKEKKLQEEKARLEAITKEHISQVKAIEAAWDNVNKKIDIVIAKITDMNLAIGSSKKAIDGLFAESDVNTLSSMATSAKAFTDAMSAVNKMTFTGLKNIIDNADKLNKILMSGKNIPDIKVEAKTKNSPDKNLDEEEKKLNLIQERSKLMQKMIGQYSQDPNVTETAGWKADTDKLTELTRRIASMYKNMDEAKKAVKEFEQALYPLRNTTAFKYILEEAAQLRVELGRLDAQVKNRVSVLDGTQARLDARNEDKAYNQKEKLDQADLNAYRRQKAQEDAIWLAEERRKAQEAKRIAQQTKAEIGMYKASGDTFEQNLLDDKQITANTKSAFAKQKAEQKAAEAAERAAVRKAEAEQRVEERKAAAEQRAAERKAAAEQRRQEAAQRATQRQAQLVNNELNKLYARLELLEKQLEDSFATGLKISANTYISKLRQAQAIMERLAVLTGDDGWRDRRGNPYVGGFTDEPKLRDAEIYKKYSAYHDRQFEPERALAEAEKWKNKLEQLNARYKDSIDYETPMSKKAYIDNYRKATVALNEYIRAMQRAGETAENLKVLNPNAYTQYKYIFDQPKRVGQLYQEYNKLIAKLREYKGVEGKSFSVGALNAYKIKLNDVIQELSQITGGRVKLTDDANNALKDVNVTQPKTDSTGIAKHDNRIKQLNADIAIATANAERMFLELQKAPTAINKIRFDVAKKQLNDLQKDLETVNKELNISDNIANRFQNTLKTRVRWVTSGMMAGQALNVIPDTMNSYVDLEKTMAGVQQVMEAIDPISGWSKESLENKAETLHTLNQEIQEFVNISAQYAQNVNDTALAAQLWGRGYGHSSDVLASVTDVNGDTHQLDERAKQLEAMRQTNELVSQSAMLAAVDNFSMEESVKGLEAILSAYGMRARSAAEATAFVTTAVDSLTKVAHTGQISAQDLVQGIEATGQAASQAGISLEFLEAMVETGVRNTGRSGSEIGQAIKALTVGIHSSKGVKELQKFGIEIYKIGADGTKRLRPLQEVILDIGSAIQKGDKNAEKMLLAIAGGRYQYSKLSSILRDRDEILRMWGNAVNSSGFAKNQLSLQMDTIASKLKKIRADLVGLVQDAANGTGGNIAKTLLDVIDWLIRKVHEFSGAIKAAGVALGASLTAKTVSKLAYKFSDLIGVVKAYNTALKESNMTLRQGAAEVASVAGAKAKSVGSKATGIGQHNNEYKSHVTSLDTSGVLNNTSIINANTKATEKETQAKKANAKATTVTTINEKAASTAKKASAGASAILEAGVNGVTAAETRMALATTLATAGLNVVVALITGALIVAYDKLNSDVEKTSYVLAKSGEDFNDITEATVDSAEEMIDKLKEEVKMREEQTEFLKTARDRYTELKASVDAASTSDEKKAENNQKMIELEGTLSQVLGEAAVERLREANFSKDAWDSELATFQKDTEGKKQSLNDMEFSFKTYYTNQYRYNSWMADQYRQNLDNFKNYVGMNLDGLSAWQSGWVKFMQFLSECFDWMSKGFGDLADKSESMADNMLKNPLTFLQGSALKAAAIKMRGIAETSAGLKGFFTEIGEDTIKEALGEYEKKEAEAISKLSAGRAPNYGGTLDNGIVDTSEEDAKAAKKAEQEARKAEREANKAKRAEQKAEREVYKKNNIIDYRNDRLMDYDAVVTTEIDKKLTQGQLLSLSAILHGDSTGDPWGAYNRYYREGDYDAWKVPQSILDKYVDGRTDEESKAWAFSKFINEKSGGSGDIRKAILDYLGIARPDMSTEDADTAYKTILNEGNFYDQKNDYDKLKASFSHGTYGGTMGTGYNIDAFENSFLATEALSVSLGVQQKYHKYVPPNMLYGLWMAETPNDHSLEEADANGDWLAGLKGKYDTIADWEKAMINTIGKVDGYDNRATQNEFVDDAVRNGYVPASSADYGYRLTAAQHANEAAWHLGGSGGAGGYIPESQYNDRGYDTRYVDLSYADSGTNTEVSGVQDSVKQRFNELARQVYLATNGVRLMITGGDEKNAHTISESHQGHEDGWKLDIHPNVSAQTLANLADQLGIAVGNEGNHFDLSFGGGGVGGTQITSRATGDPNFAVSGAVGGTAKNAYNWKGGASGGKLVIGNWQSNSYSELEQLEKLQKAMFDVQEKRIKRLQELGNTEEADEATRSLDIAKVNLQASQLRRYKAIGQSAYKEYIDYMNGDSDVQNALNRNGKKIGDLSPSDVDKLLESMKNSGKDIDRIKNVWEVVKGFDYDRNGKSIKIAGIDEELQNLQLQLLKNRGFLSPKEREDYALEQLQSDFESHKGSMDGEDKNAAEANYHQKRLDVYQERLKRLQQDKRAADSKYNDEVNSLRRDRNNQKGVVDSLEARQAKGEDVKNELEKQKQLLDALNATYEETMKYGTLSQRNIGKQISETTKLAEEERKKVQELNDKFKEAAADMTNDFFDKLINDGKDLRSILEDIRKEVAKIAMKRLINTAFGIKNKWGDSPIEQILQRLDPRSRNRVTTDPNRPQVADFLPANQRWQTYNPFDTSRSVGTTVEDKMKNLSSQYKITGDSLKAKPFEGFEQAIKSNTAAVNAQKAATTADTTAKKANTIAQKASTTATQVSNNVTSEQVVNDMATSNIEQADTQSSIASNKSLENAVYNAANAANNLASKASTGGANVSVGNSGKIAPMGYVGMGLSLYNAFKKADGGFIPTYANGGDTQGLIRGAGTGTSDSILTYLAHRGQFIRTSDGEYIIKKDTVDKVGVPFLDRLNQNPEAVKALSAYADGGSLGEAMSPSMSAAAAKSYRTYAQNQAAIKQGGTGRLESLMEEQTGVIKNMGKGDNGGKIVVLNTQADSSSVMKAIAKDPKTFQRIMRGNSRHGFR